jgi:hypothetical protein
MTHAVDDGLAKAFPAAPWLFQPAPSDTLVVLAKALGGDWDVMRETDCEGEVSIIALSAIEADWMPSLILYEKDGTRHVAMVRGDEWRGERSFRTLEQATDAFIAMARTFRIVG